VCRDSVRASSHELISLATRSPRSGSCSTGGHQRSGQRDRPAPATNSEFTAALATAVGRRDLPCYDPAWRCVGLGEAAVELLNSAVSSRTLTEAGYEFRTHAARSLAAELASR